MWVGKVHSFLAVKSLGLQNAVLTFFKITFG